VIELCALIGATPRRIRGKVETAASHRIAVCVGATFEMLAFGSHCHISNFTSVG